MGNDLAGGTAGSGGGGGGGATSFAGGAPGLYSGGGGGGGNGAVGAAGAHGVIVVTYVSIGISWFRPLSEPVRFKPGLAAHQQQFAAYSPNPLTIIPFDWYRPLSEPVRKLPGLHPAQQQFAAFNPQPFVSFSWFQALSIPAVRTLPGLRASEQQFLAQPPQLRPTPTITGVLDAHDHNVDTFEGSGTEFNRVVSGEAGVIPLNFTGSQITVVEAAPPIPASGAPVSVNPVVSGFPVSVVVPASGKPVLPVTRAHVSISIKTS
jgi:hypothetical protein